MCYWCDCSCKRYDWNEILAYKTVKLVKVKDKRLGCLRYFFMLVIVGYIFGFVMLFQQRYLDLEVPVGAVATSIRKPPGEVYNKNYTYCTQDDGGKHCMYPHECLIWDAEQVEYPPDAYNSMFITTRATVGVQEWVCKNPDEPCDHPWVFNKPPKSYYMSSIEDYTVKITHSFQARTFYRQTKCRMFAGTNTNMHGQLEDSSGNVYMKFTKEHGDIIPLGLLLKVAHTDLDSESDAPGHFVNGSVRETKRSSGVILLLTIAYSNLFERNPFKLWNCDVVPEYTMTVSRFPQAEYKIVEVVRLNRTHRLNVNRHGVKIVFTPTGSLGMVSVQTTIVQLGSALGLLSVATLVVELCMLYCCEAKKQYKEFKYQQTPSYEEWHRNRTLLEVDEDGNTIMHGSINDPGLGPKPGTIVDPDDMTYDDRVEHSMTVDGGNADLANLRRKLLLPDGAFASDQYVADDRDEKSAVGFGGSYFPPPNPHNTSQSDYEVTSGRNNRLESTGSTISFGDQNPGAGYGTMNDSVQMQPSSQAEPSESGFSRTQGNEPSVSAAPSTSLAPDGTKRRKKRKKRKSAFVRAATITEDLKAALAPEQTEEQGA